LYVAKHRKSSHLAIEAASVKDSRKQTTSVVETTQRALLAIVTPQNVSTDFKMLRFFWCNRLCLPVFFFATVVQ